MLKQGFAITFGQWSVESGNCRGGTWPWNAHGTCMYIPLAASHISPIDNCCPSCKPSIILSILNLVPLPPFSILWIYRHQLHLLHQVTLLIAELLCCHQSRHSALRALMPPTLSPKNVRSMLWWKVTVSKMLTMTVDPMIMNKPPQTPQWRLHPRLIRSLAILSPTTTSVYVLPTWDSPCYVPNVNQSGLMELDHLSPVASSLHSTIILVALSKWLKFTIAPYFQTMSLALFTISVSIAPYTCRFGVNGRCRGWVLKKRHRGHGCSCGWSR